jgi:hypothetical protein
MMRALAECNSDYETNLVERIQNGDWQVTSVFEKRGEDLPFAYTIGIFQNFGQPELLMVGPDSKSAAHYVNRYGALIKEKGETYAPDNFYSGIMDNLDVCMINANSEAKDEYTLSCNWYYRGRDYPLMQCIWPSSKGFWPWDPHAWDDYKKLQPLYGKPPRIQ